MPISEPQRYFTCNEVARMLRRTRRTIYRWIGEGYLKDFKKVRDGYLIPEKEIHRILNEQTSVFS